MGQVRFSCAPDLIRGLADCGNIDAAVETGTFKGEGTLILREHVSRVKTIELDERLYERAVARYGNRAGIEFCKGSSTDVLSEVVAQINEPVIFWLDAHGGMFDHLQSNVFDPAGNDTQCPLVAELRVVRDFPHVNASCVLIDDARAFLGPLPQHRRTEWPSLIEILDLLRIADDRYITILDDVIIAVPSELRSVIDDWWLKQISDREGRDAQEQQLWEAYNPNPRKAARLLAKSLAPSFLRRAYERRA